MLFIHTSSDCPMACHLTNLSPCTLRACAYTPKTQSDFVANHLGPQLEQDHPDVKIFIFDHNKDHVITWAEGLLNQTKASAKYVSGTAYHWYAGGMVSVRV